MARRSSIFIKIWCWRVTFQSKADSTCKSQDDEDVETTGDKSCKCGKFVINRTTFMRITSLPLVQRHCCAESLAVLFENAYLISNGLQVISESQVISEFQVPWFAPIAFWVRFEMTIVVPFYISDIMTFCTFPIRDVVPAPQLLFFCAQQ